MPGPPLPGSAVTATGSLLMDEKHVECWESAEIVQVPCVRVKAARSLKNKLTLAAIDALRLELVS